MLESEGSASPNLLDSLVPTESLVRLGGRGWQKISDGADARLAFEGSVEASLAEELIEIDSAGEPVHRRSTRDLTYEITKLTAGLCKQTANAVLQRVLGPNAGVRVQDAGG